MKLKPLSLPMNIVFETLSLLLKPVRDTLNDALTLGEYQDLLPREGTPGGDTELYLVAFAL